MRHLQCLLAVAQHGSLQRAAEALSITQPAVSKTIAELEELLGVRLFERGRNGARPTAQADLFLRHAGASVSALRQGIDLLARTTGAAGGVIEIAVLPTLAAALVPPVLTAFRETWPGVVVQVHTGPNPVLVAQLKSSQVALAVGRLSDPEAMTGLTFEHLCTTPLAIVVRPAHPLARRASVSIADVIACHVIVPPRGTIIRHAADGFLLSHSVGALPDYSEMLSMSLARTMTLRDDLVWIVPEIAVQHDVASGALVALPFVMRGTEESVGLMLRNDAVPTPPELTLINAFREVTRTRRNDES
ncbi:pca operon transcription factor PcaQ [Pandoraea terrae]